MILFITRKHPPSIGGMQRLSRDLTRAVGKLTPTRTIAWGGSTALLPFFLPYAFVKAMRAIPRQVEIIHLSDGLLAPLGVVLKRIYRVPVVVTVHGLDITYSNPLYQRLAPGWLRQMDRLICVSSYTRDECLRRGIWPGRCLVIPNGVYTDEFAVAPPADGRATLERLAGEKLRGRKVLLTVGRLIERKGVANFVNTILPRIIAADREVCYLVVGEGPQHALIERRITERGLADHVVMLGQVDEPTLHAAYSRADLFVMPNIPVPGDVEGFGLVALEAAAAGLYVAASRLDGIPEAIVDGQNGSLLDVSDPAAFAEAVVDLLRDRPRMVALGETARDFVREHFDWQIIAQRYMQTFEQVVARRNQPRPGKIAADPPIPPLVGKQSEGEEE